jgi:hypothetical protein
VDEKSEWLEADGLGGFASGTAEASYVAVRLKQLGVLTGTEAPFARATKARFDDQVWPPTSGRG